MEGLDGGLVAVWWEGPISEEWGHRRKETGLEGVFHVAWARGGDDSGV